MSLIWSRTEAHGRTSITVIFSNGDVVTVGNENPNLPAITLKLATPGTPENEIRELINPAAAIAQRFRNLSDRITTDGNNIFLDGDVIHDSLADYILRLVRLEAQGNTEVSYAPFVNFLEKLAQNPSEKSRKSLYNFITHHGLTILPNGDFLAYKGVQQDFGSISKGPGIVNGVKLNGSLPNKPGNTLWVERSYVDDNDARGCSAGLHAGTPEYASNWSGSVGRVVAVAINPRDVVSVPNDLTFQKIRTARYTVLHEAPRVERSYSRESFDPNRTAPLYRAPKIDEIVKPEILKNLKDAVASGAVVTVNYSPKWGATRDYEVIVERIDLNSIKVQIPGENHPRTFSVSGINSVSVPAAKPAAEKVADAAAAASDVLDDVVKVITKAVKKSREIVIDYASPDSGNRFYTVVPRGIAEGVVPLLKLVDDFRTFRLDRINDVEIVKNNKDDKPKKGKKSKKNKKGNEAKNKRHGNVVNVAVSGESKQGKH